MVILMVSDLQVIEVELRNIRNNVEFIKAMLSEDRELADSALLRLKEARGTPEGEYVDLE